MRTIQILNNENISKKETITELLKNDSIKIKVDGGWLDEPTDQFINGLERGVAVELLCPYCHDSKATRNPFMFSAAMALTHRGRMDPRKLDWTMDSFHDQCLEDAKKDEELLLKTSSLLFGSEKIEDFLYKGLEGNDEIANFLDLNSDVVFSGDGSVDFDGAISTFLNDLEKIAPESKLLLENGLIEFDPLTKNLTRVNSKGFGLDVLM